MVRKKLHLPFTMHENYNIQQGGNTKLAFTDLDSTIIDMSNTSGLSYINELITSAYKTVSNRKVEYSNKNLELLPASKSQNVLKKKNQRKNKTKKSEKK